MQPTLSGHASVHSVSIVRGIHCSTQHAEYHHCSTSRRGEEPSAVVRVVLLLELHGGVFVLLFFISDKVHVYSGEGRKTAAQHVMNDIDQPTMLEYILASVRARLCVLAPRLSQGTAGWLFAVN